jgi:hypothetical protein
LTRVTAQALADLASPITTPYCKINDIKYQLAYDKQGVLRFPDDGRLMPDLNKMVVDYAHGRLPLRALFEYDVNSGSSYELVYGRYSKGGINNHIVKQGPEQTKKFALYSGSKEK